MSRDFNGNLDLQIDLDSGYYDEEEECYQCGMLVHPSKLRVGKDGECAYCQPKEDEEE